MKNKLLFTSLLLVTSFTSNAQFWDITEPAQIGGTVNTIETEESIPVFSKDSSRLYFVRTIIGTKKGAPNGQDIWYCTKGENDTYTNSKQLNSLNNKFNNAVLGINKTGTSMYLLNSYDGKKDVLKGLAVSTNKNGNWSAPIPVKIPTLDINGDFYGFHVNEDENVIIISYEGPNSLGEEDLYVSTKTGETWSAPIHMGAVINSVGYEMSPFLNKSQDTLYFSSNGFGGEGDADIFYSVKQGSWSSWSAPINLGNRINSPKFDAYFIQSGDQIYWSSNRENERSDIYNSAILTPPLLFVTCAATNVSEFAGNDGAIDVTLEGGVAPFDINWSNGYEGEDLTNMVKGSYSVTITDAIGQTATTSCTITEPAPPEDKPIRLPEVRYPLNEWTLLVDATINSTDSLIYVYELLKDNPGLILELSSHTDSRGSRTMNQKLSTNRAIACYKYLVEEKGIDPRRIVPIGKGEGNPKTVWKKGDVYLTSAPKDMTGVTAIVLKESYINKFKRKDPELFKQLHQFNRRTEGRVISMDFDQEKTPASDPKLLIFIKYP